MIFISLIAAVLIGIACHTSKSESLETPLIQAAANDKTNAKPIPVIVELFTSEGCSSCPPADKVLAILNRNHSVENVEIIGLSLHVDYWNRLGWKDPFSSPQFSNRQGAYSQFFGKNGNVYTPQMIVDGTREFEGNNAGKALQAIGEAAKDAKGNVLVEIEKLENNTAQLKIKIENLPKMSKNDAAIILLAVTEDNLSSQVTRGENSGSDLAHVGVVRWMQNVGNIPQEGKTFSQIVVFDKSWKQEDLNAVVFVQEIGSRRILGATKIKLQA
ncbi:MAG: DUF1223 domain-containing protein [Acidobacteriota bacterium]|nr:DUF1223 domain-containing protein [Acidobacteriota bacterium]